MSTETLPGWFWIIYYLFLFITLGASVFSLIRKIHIKITIITIIFVITIPIVSLINSIGRNEGLNEFNHLFNQIQQGTLWSIYVVIGYLFLFIWWFVFISSNKNNKFKSKSL